MQPPERDGAAEAPGGGAGTAQLIAPRPHHALRPGPVPPQTGHIRRGRGEGGELVFIGHVCSHPPHATSTTHVLVTHFGRHLHRYSLL